MEVNIISSSPQLHGHVGSPIVLPSPVHRHRVHKDGDNSSPSRRSPVKSAPNLLHRSMLRKAVKKGVLPSEDRKKVCYSSPGHHCWSSLKIREWQEFQKLISDENFTNGDLMSRNSYMYFTNSPQAASRASKRTIRRQMASPDSDYYNKERAKDFVRIEQAISAINFARDQKRNDYLSGVPKEFLDKLNSSTSDLANNDDDNNKDQIRFRTPPKSESEMQTRASSSKYSVPGLYVFPKQTDFVPPEGTKLQPIGVQWKYSNCHRSQSAQSTGKLLRGIKPVTEGLHKHGTSIAQIRGKPLKQGEWNIHKVWNHKVDEHSRNPLEMARSYKSSMVRDRTMKQRPVIDECKDENEEDTLSIEAQSIGGEQSSSSADYEEDLDEHSLLSD